jgi:hypothetical protein
MADWSDNDYRCCLPPPASTIIAHHLQQVLRRQPRQRGRRQLPHPRLPKLSLLPACQGHLRQEAAEDPRLRLCLLSQRGVLQQSSQGNAGASACRTFNRPCVTRCRASTSATAPSPYARASIRTGAWAPATKDTATEPCPADARHSAAPPPPPLACRRTPSAAAARATTSLAHDALVQTAVCHAAAAGRRVLPPRRRRRPRPLSPLNELSASVLLRHDAPIPHLRSQFHFLEKQSPPSNLEFERMSLQSARQSASSPSTTPFSMSSRVTDSLNACTSACL